MIPINLVISGGGVKLFYFIGMYCLFRKIIKRDIIKIQSYSAISSGSVFITLMACDICPSKIIKIYKKYILLFQQRLKLNISKFKLLERFLYEILPDNAHIICTNKVFITTTLLNFPLKKITFSKFTCKKDLVDILLCSSSFPILVNKSIYKTYKNKNYIDGCFSSNTPIINKNNTIIFRPFLVGHINLFSLEIMCEIIHVS